MAPSPLQNLEMAFTAEWFKTTGQQKPLEPGQGVGGGRDLPTALRSCVKLFLQQGLKSCCRRRQASSRVA